MIRTSAVRNALVLSSTVGVAAVLATAALGGVTKNSVTATPTLVGTVGPGYTITLTMNGKPVKTLKSGTYKLVIHDKASIHAFSLDGPNGYAKDFTTVPFIGTKTFTVNFKPGAYKAYCPPHESIMFDHFKVT